MTKRLQSEEIPDPSEQKVSLVWPLAILLAAVIALLL